MAPFRFPTRPPDVQAIIFAPQWPGGDLTQAGLPGPLLAARDPSFCKAREPVRGILGENCMAVDRLNAGRSVE
jgi:hypothetical protein